MYWIVSNQFALMQVDFEDVWTVLGKCQDGRVFKLFAFVEFKLEMISIS
jgi:hypothetical protein